MRRFQYMAAPALAAMLSGCTTLQPQDFAKSNSRFELDRYFEGHSRSWGVLENTNGGPLRSFTCDNRGRRDKSGDLVLTQQFQFSDGKKQTRAWQIHRVDSTHWEATANDMIGIAKGHGEGNALYWEYNFTLDRKDPMATVHIRQWMYQPERTTDPMTRLVISKLGLTIFEVSEVIHQVPVESEK